MSNYAADDTQAIAQRLKEIEAEKKVFADLKKFKDLVASL